MIYGYVAKLSAPQVFKKYFEAARVKPAQQAQKYHRLMAEGLAANEDVQVTVIGMPPISRKITKTVFFPSEMVNDGGVTYQSMRLVNLPILLQIAAFFSTFHHVRNLCRKDPDCTIVCDVLNITMSAAALLAAKFSRAKTVGIVTDVPMFLGGKLQWITKPINQFLLSRFSAFVLLTEQMDAVVNKRNSPYVVIEGQADIRMSVLDNELTGKAPERVCMYAGSVNKVNGIDMLVKAFIMANISDVVLQIYGKGDYEAELKQICEEHANIRFGGAVPNEYIIMEQIKAMLLINPLPTHQEYTKYSFPSKTLEYMASGTPVLTTKLPGMPKDYYPYVYLIEDETAEGLKENLQDLLARPMEELHDKGAEAKDFVLSEKNNVFQAAKMIELAKVNTD